MPNHHSKGPKPACFEEYDDDNDTTISDTRVFANASTGRAKDGSDSGYSSRAGTLDSGHLDSKNASPDLQKAPIQLERQRNPYSSGPVDRRKSMSHQSHPSRARVPAQPDVSSSQKDFRHPKGLCYTCDRYGRHISQRDHDAILNGLRNGPTHSDKKPEAPKAQPEKQEAGKIMRRMSTRKDERPPLQYEPAATIPRPVYDTAHSAYPQTSHVAPVLAAVASYAYPVIPAAPIFASRVPDPGYFDHAAPTGANPPLRRSNVQNRQPIAQVSYDDYETVYPDGKEAPTMKTVKLISKVDKRPNDFDRSMPPPPRPGPKMGTPGRPPAKHRTSYADYSQYRDDERDQWEDVPGSRRGIFGHDDHPKARNRSPSPHRHDNTKLNSRPRPRHSVSEPYVSQPRSNDRTDWGQKDRPVARPVTERDSKTVDYDAKLANAEAHMERQGAPKTSDALVHKDRTSSSAKSHPRSESGSNHSHQSRRDSYYSSSKVSTHSKSSRRGSIVIETGGKKARPVSISMPEHGVTIQIGSSAEEKPATTKSHKLIEHAPSQGSTASRSSATRSRAATSATDYTPSDRTDRGRERQDYLVTRRTHVIDSQPPPSPIKMKSTRSSSRSGSRSRALTDSHRKR